MGKFNLSLSQNGNSEQNVGISTVLKGVILAYCITIIIFLVFSFFITYTDFSESTIPTIVVVTTMISILIAGAKVAKRAKNKGWLNGAIVGFTYMIILYIMSCLALTDFIFDSYVAYMFVLGLFSGALGGIIGINLKSKRR